MGAISDLFAFLGSGLVYSQHHIIYYTAVPRFPGETKSHFKNIMAMDLELLTYLILIYLNCFLTFTNIRLCPSFEQKGNS